MEENLITQKCDYIKSLNKEIDTTNACTDGTILVTLSIIFNENLTDINIKDIIANQFIDSVTDINPNIGTVAPPGNSLNLLWNIPEIDADVEAILTYTVNVSEKAYGKEGFVNTNIVIKPTGKNACTFKQNDGFFNDQFILNCNCDAINLISKEVLNPQVDCDKLVDVKVTFKIADDFIGDIDNLVFTDIINTDCVSNIQDVIIVPNDATPAIFSDRLVVTFPEGLKAGASYEIYYSVKPNLSKPNGTVNTSILFEGTIVNGNESDMLNCLYTPSNTEEIFNDSYTLNCDVISADCCCSDCKEFTTLPCETFKREGIVIDQLDCSGKVITIDVNLFNVCVGKKIIVGIFLIELIQEGDDTEYIEVPRGFKVKEFVVPVSDEPCTDIAISNFCFILEDSSPCESRKFIAKALAHYTNGFIPECDCFTP